MQTPTTILRAYAPFALVLACALLGGCTSSPVPIDTMGDGLAFGRLCAATEECSSQLCVSTGAAGAVCSRVCLSDSDCPNAENWGCVLPNGADFRVCGCLSDSDEEICEDGRDNNCDGIVDDCRLCDDAMVSRNDPLNCGRCDNACRSDQACIEGECACPAFGQMECDGACVDTLLSTSNCGGCGVACGSGQVCRNNACTCANPAQPDFCGNTCVDTDTSMLNCGRCGLRCSAGQVCADGACVCPAGPASTFCGLAGCVDATVDPANCGACGVVCSGAGIECRDGTCQCELDTPDVCGEDCVDLQTDELNCGSCGEVCDPALLCVGGSCQCPAGTHIFCDGVCHDPTSDAQHCGGCGQACRAGERCTATGCECESGVYCGEVCQPVNDDQNCGDCGYACAAGQHCSGTSCECDIGGLTACGDWCVQTANDPAYCGACDNACRNTELCSGGGCACPTGLTWCEEAGACVNLASDDAHCGACGTACPNETTCSGGSCRCAGVNEIYCAAADGCVNRYTNAEHCGACDQACENTQICTTASCRCGSSSEIYCASADMCVNRYNDPAHCGACDAACRNTEICQSGFCRCSPGETFCESADRCVPLDTSNEHCGACDNACATDATCGAGTCSCDDSGLTHCAETCVDLATSNTHCGTCDNVCAADRVCTDSACLCQAPTRGARVVVADDAPDQEERIVVARVPGAMGDTVGVAWSNTTTQEVFFRTYDSSGVPLSPVLTFGDATTTVKGVDLISNGTEFALSALVSPVASADQFVRVVRLDVAGAVVSDATIDFLLGSAGERTSIAWAPGTGYAVAVDAGRFGVVGVNGASTPPLLSGIGTGMPRATGLPGGGFAILSVTNTLPYLRLTDSTGLVLETTGQLSNGGGPFFAVRYSDEFSITHDGSSLVAVLQLVRYGLSSQIMVRNHEVEVMRGDRLQNRLNLVTYMNQDILLTTLGGLSADLDNNTLVVTYARQEGTVAGQMARFGARFALPAAESAAPTVLNAPELWSTVYNSRERFPTVTFADGGVLTGFTDFSDGDDGVELQPFEFPACAP